MGQAGAGSGRQGQAGAQMYIEVWGRQGQAGKGRGTDVHRGVGQAGAQMYIEVCGRLGHRCT